MKRLSTLSRLVTLTMVLPPMVVAAPPPGTRLSFVSCPIIRDTRSVPCWLSDYQSDRYYLTIQSDVSAEVQPPLMGHQVLVEGVVSDAPNICGGVVLSQVHLSAMPELDANCREELPADDRYLINFNPRPPGPSSGRLAFAADPSAVGAPPRRATPASPGNETIDVFFDFDKGVSFRHPAMLVSILDAAQRSVAKRIRVTGFRGAHRLSNGVLLQESPETGRLRAQEVARLLSGAGLSLPAEVNWIGSEKDADGIDDWRSRRVTVELLP